MPICPLHRQVYMMDTDCVTCVKENVIAMSVEYDKQDRARDTMSVQGHEFDPTRSRAIMVFSRQPLFETEEALQICERTKKLDPNYYNIYCKDMHDTLLRNKKEKEKQS